MKTARETGLDAAVMKWYLQERSVGINVRGVEIMSAANRLTSMITQYFKYILYSFLRTFAKNGLLQSTDRVVHTFIRCFEG